MEESEMPSKVTDKKKKLIRMPPSGNVVESDEEWRRCGKWILSIDKADMDFADRAWVDLQPLLEDGTLILLKASTAMLKISTQVLCFTRPGLEVIKRAASAIRRVVDFKGIMFYKPKTKPAEKGMSKREGYSRACVYMHTYRGRFYTKDGIGRWIPDNEDGEKKVSPKSQSYIQNYSGRVPLPSKSKERVLTLGVVRKGNPKWFLFCSCIEEEDGPPEVDRVWAAGEGLLDEGRLAGLSAHKWGTGCQVRLYLPRDSVPASSQLEWLCDRVFREACVRGIMYHTGLENDSSSYSAEEDNTECQTQIERGRLAGEGEERGRGGETLGHDFLYTSGGELYKSVGKTNVFVSSRLDASQSIELED